MNCKKFTGFFGAASSFAAAAVVIASSFPAQAQDDFPSKPIEVVSAASPGGGTDTTIRMWLDAAQEILGEDIVVVYKVGGGARSAHEYLASQPADGHSIIALTPTHLYTIARGHSPLGIGDLQGVARAMDDPSVITVRGDSDIGTYEDLIARSKEQPLNWGVAAIGSTEHIGIARWADKAGVEYRVVPFGSGGEMVTALRSGAIDVTLANISEALRGINDGDLKPIAILAEERLGELPDVPTAAEKGHGVSASTTRGYAVLSGTPPERVKILEDALLEAMKSERFQQYLRSTGLNPEQSLAGSKEWDQQLKQSYAEEKAVIDRLGLAEKK